MSEDKFTQNENSNRNDLETKNNKETNQELATNTSLGSEKDQTEIAENEKVETTEIKKSETVETGEAEAVENDDIKTGDKQAPPSNKSKKNISKILQIVCLIGFLVFTGLFINEVVIQPIRIKNSIDLTRDLYHKPTEAPIATTAPVVTAAVTPVTEATPTPDPNRDSQGRLLQFEDLLETNGDVKGWITIPDTNIDYVVTQSSDKDNPDYYLDKDIKGEYSKAGTLYIDPRSSVEDNTKNLVIHGHNMVSTKEKMFHYLLEYTEEETGVSYYKEHPVINFDTIYDTAKWKIFAVVVTNGSSEKEPLYEYRTSAFKDNSAFMNFVYQIRIRSVLNLDMVDVNENDELLTLSTCSYELDNYRTVIFARKIREGEDPSVEVEKAAKNETPLYPESYYYRKGGKAPEVAATFEEALETGEIKWYTAPTE